MDSCRVFYSWQSDLPNSTNRGFVQDALERAAKAIREDDSITVEPVVDRDTVGIPGSPDIASTIFAKIDESSVFACDVSIVNQDDKGRKMPNANVLIELGYAMKALKPDRILMVMNTAFGGPGLLPFDLSKKRVMTYELAEGGEEKANIRKELTRKLEDGLRTILDHMHDAVVPGKLSGDSAKLKVECEAVLATGNVFEWRKLVGEIWRDIPHRLLEWKPRAESVWSAGGKQRDDIRLEAAEICLPCIVPILVAVENGKADLWEAAANSLRQLSLMRERMGGGITDVLEIGSHMLYVVGNLGMGFAVQTVQLGFINLWMALPMPETIYGQTQEKKWAEVYQAHHLWGKYLPGTQDPFKDIVKIAEPIYLVGFFPDKVELVKCLFLGNLAQSLFELGRWIEKGRKEATSVYDQERERFRTEGMNVWPIWGMMTSEEFRSGTWQLFGSAYGVFDFVFREKGTDSESQFWEYWKKWKQACCGILTQGELQRRTMRVFRPEWLTLPGEPSDA